MSGFDGWFEIMVILPGDDIYSVSTISRDFYQLTQKVAKSQDYWRRVLISSEFDLGCFRDHEVVNFRHVYTSMMNTINPLLRASLDQNYPVCKLLLSSDVKQITLKECVKPWRPFPESWGDGDIRIHVGGRKKAEDYIFIKLNADSMSISDSLSICIRTLEEETPRSEIYATAIIAVKNNSLEILKLALERLPFPGIRANAYLSILLHGSEEAWKLVSDKSSLIASLEQFSVFVTEYELSGVHILHRIFQCLQTLPPDSDFRHEIDQKLLYTCNHELLKAAIAFYDFDITKHYQRMLAIHARRGPSWEILLIMYQYNKSLDTAWEILDYVGFITCEKSFKRLVKEMEISLIDQKEILDRLISGKKYQKAEIFLTATEFYDSALLKSFLKQPVKRRDFIKVLLSNSPLPVDIQDRITSIDTYTPDILRLVEKIIQHSDNVEFQDQFLAAVSWKPDAKFIMMGCLVTAIVSFYYLK
ncbi:Hypothetical protein POVR1_LOCUS259 [uncultured virus]|nr:Hypothetical protein POVR1_LOCUS259 [uncultured virus]